MAALKLPIDEVVHFTVTTRDPSTGGEVDADSAPTFNIYEEATDSPIASSPITMTKRTSLTGRYRGTFTMSSANGFEAGKFYDVIVTGTVGGITDNAPVMLIHCVPAESVTGVPKVDQHALGGDAQSTTDLKDFADAGYDPATNKVQGVVLVDTTTTNSDMISAAGIRTAVGLGSANLDTQLGDLPTNAELATSQAAADDATLAAIAALNNISTAQVNAEVDTALSDAGVTLARMGALTDWIDGGRLDLLLDSVVADNPNRPTRGAALADLVFTMVDATDFATPETGIAVTATISKDGGAFAACSNSVSEISGGFYKLTLTASEMTADSVALKLTGTGCAQRAIVIRTQPT